MQGSIHSTIHGFKNPLQGLEHISHIGGLPYFPSSFSHLEPVTISAEKPHYSFPRLGFPLNEYSMCFLIPTESMIIIMSI